LLANFNSIRVLSNRALAGALFFLNGITFGAVIIALWFMRDVQTHMCRLPVYQRKINCPLPWLIAGSFVSVIITGYFGSWL
jgi:hypothetical protein